MTRITTTNQKKNTTIPGIAYPATVMTLATDSSYPGLPELSAIAYGASPDGSAAASASQFRSASSSGSPLARKVRKAALFTLLIVDRGSPATTVTCMRHLEVGQLGRARRDDLPGQRVTVPRAVRGHDERHRHLVQLGVRPGHHGGLGDAGHLGDDALDLAGGDVLAADPEHVLGPVRERDPAVGVHCHQVTGAVMVTSGLPGATPGPRHDSVISMG